MIIQKHLYYCYKCHEAHSFEVDKPFSTICPKCNKEMKYESTYDCDTELAEKRKNQPPNIIVKDGSRFRPLIKCPTCSSTKVKSISSTDRVLSTSFFGLASNKINKSFECKTCGYTW